MPLALPVSPVAARPSAPVTLSAAAATAQAPEGRPAPSVDRVIEALTSARTQAGNTKAQLGTIRTAWDAHSHYYWTVVGNAGFAARKAGQLLQRLDGSHQAIADALRGAGSELDGLAQRGEMLPIHGDLGKKPLPDDLRASLDTWFDTVASEARKGLDALDPA